MSISLNAPSTLDKPNKRQQYQFQLVAIVLITIFVSIIGIGLILAFQDFDAAGCREDVPLTGLPVENWNGPPMDDSLNLAFRTDAATIAQVEKREYREFFLKICQMVLLNLLLPILTATLGFKMGARKEETLA